MRRRLRQAVVLCCLILTVSVASAQKKTFTGTVLDSSGLPIPFATVQEKGTSTKVSANDHGVFKINVEPGATLEVSSIGFGIQTIVAASSPITVTLAGGKQNAGEEVVVTALGIKRDKRMLTYSTQEISGSAIVDAKQDNIVNALAGKLSGVQITNSTGQPGSSSQIVIRGNASLNGDNNALFVIDGIPMDNSEAGNPDGPLSAGGTSNRAIDIDPNIIASITVLKGAAASAIYGSNAAKGVILITTKNGRGGKSGQPNVSFSSSYTWAKANLPELQTKYGQGSNGAYVDGNIEGQHSSMSWGPRVDTLRVNGAPVPIHNQLKEFLKTAHTTDNNLSVSGFTDKTNYVVSYSFLKNDGMIPTTDYVRNSFFAKYGIKISDKVNLTTQFNYIHSNNNRTLDGNSLESPLWTVLGAPITWNAHPTTYADGTQQIYRAARNNPYWLLDNTGLKDRVDRIIPALNLSYTPNTWLTFTERLGGDMYTNATDYHENIGTVGSYPTGRIYNRIINYQQFNNDLFANARANITPDLYLDAVVGHNVLFNFNDSRYDQGVGLSVPGFYNISNATTVTSQYEYYKFRKVGFYAQANFEYKRFLTLSLTGRYDGSSKLAAAEQFFPYGSASLGFIFTDALHISSNSVLSFGKVRISYSSVGNDNISPYAMSIPYIQPNSANSTTINNINFPYNGQNGFLLSTAYTTKLKSEHINEFETGIELKFLKNRIWLDAAYFSKKSTNLLTTGVPYDGATGFSSLTTNAGSMQNKGVEITLGAKPVKTENFNWDVTLNFTKIKNRVLALAPNVSYLQFAGFTSPGIFAYANSPYGVIYGTHFLRDSSGRLLLNDDGKPQIADGASPIGNATPDWLAGLTNEFSYKNFLFSFVLDMRHGGNVLNLDGHYLDFYGTSKITENRGTSKIFDGIIQSTGKKNTTPVTLDQAFYQNIWSSVDENSVYDASFLKLRQVTVGYKVPMPKSSFVKSLAFTLTGTNFILHKNYPGSDPEVSLNGSGNGQGFANFMTPTTKNFLVGVKATF